MSEWRQGFVRTMHQNEVRVEVGQEWGFFPTPGTIDGAMLLTVVSTSPDGLVVLRPQVPADVERLFPLRIVVFKGKPVQSRAGCPFQWAATGCTEPGTGRKLYEAGDLLAHEGWDVWRLHMHARSC